MIMIKLYNAYETLNKQTNKTNIKANLRIFVGDRFLVLYFLIEVRL